MLPDDSIRELARKTAKSIVDHGSIPMATLKESIKLQDKVDELLAKEVEFPEQEPFPEIPEVDLSPLTEKLDELLVETKKKDYLEYDLQIDEETRAKLKGDKGEKGKDGKNGKDGADGINGLDGINGKDGAEITPEELVTKLESLKEEERLDVSAIKGVEELLQNKVEGIKTSRGGLSRATADTLYEPIGGSDEDSFGIVVDGAGTAITTGSKGVRYIPFDCTVTGWDIRGDISGSCVFDVKRSSTSLAGTEKPTLTASTSSQNLALSTWTTSLVAGDVVEFVVDSATTLTRATLTILVTKS